MAAPSTAAATVYPVGIVVVLGAAIKDPMQQLLV